MVAKRTDKITLTMEDSATFKERVRVIGEQLKEQGEDVWDVLHERISVSKTLQVLVNRTYESLNVEKE